MNTTTHSKQERAVREQVIENCWEYLRDNFHKFSDANKIKIALSLCTKNIPTQLEGEIKVTEMPTIQAGNRLLEYNLG